MIKGTFCGCLKDKLEELLYNISASYWLQVALIYMEPHSLFRDLITAYGGGREIVRLLSFSPEMVIQ